MICYNIILIHCAGVDSSHLAQCHRVTAMFYNIQVTSTISAVCAAHPSGIPYINVQNSVLPD